MTLNDCLKFANENPVCTLATVDGDQPHLRVLMMVTADQRGFWFATLSPKAMAKQLHCNSKVEVCFISNAQDLMNCRMMRVKGQAEFVKDDAMAKKVLQDRAALAQLIGRPLEPILELFRVSSGEAHFWTLRDNLKEPELERVRF